MKGTVRISCLCVFLLAGYGGRGAFACPLTPIEWQQVVDASGHVVAEHGGRSARRKHANWIRDRDHDFIDDQIAAHYDATRGVDVIVELNRCLHANEIADFSHYGRVTYVGRLVSYLMLSGVRYESVGRLANRADVALVEWKPPLRPTDDVSSRAVQSRSSSSQLPVIEYGTNSAEGLNRTGKGVNIAILDSGVSDVFVENDLTKHHESFHDVSSAGGGTVGKFAAGFNALNFEDADLDGIDDSGNEPGDGTTNPDDGFGHGTNVAGAALGGLVAGRTACRPPEGGPSPNCAGVAPDARLVDVSFFSPEADSSHAVDALAYALDWLGDNAETLNIGVANLSYMDRECVDDDGTSALAKQIDFVVSLGVTVAVAHGNAPCSGASAGDRFTNTLASSSLAITVAASDDHGTVLRDDDEPYADGFIGPRKDFGTNASLGALKPDIAAPGMGIVAATRNTTNQYNPGDGTSMAAPHVAGAAALVLEARPTISPGSLKDLLRRTADLPPNAAPTCIPPSCTCNPAATPPCTSGVDAKWNPAFGSGLLNVYAALKAPVNLEVAFPACVPSTESLPATRTAGRPCALRGTLQPWSNTKDIDLRDDYIAAHVTGPSHTMVNVNFGVYPLAIGNRMFYPVGTQRVTIPEQGSIWVKQPLSSDKKGYPSLQVSIDFGSDKDFSNNVTQRSLQTVSVPQSGLLYEVEIDNPFLGTSRMDVATSVDQPEWTCRIVGPSRFEMVPFKNDPPPSGGPSKVQVQLGAPSTAQPGDHANCDISGKATARNHEPWSGGVTLHLSKP
jgi:subtilisin family serine protease